LIDLPWKSGLFALRKRLGKDSLIIIAFSFMSLDQPLTDLVFIEPTRHSDSRGFFAELYNNRRYSDMGILDTFVQDNHSVSNDVGTIRGLHFQSPPHAQGKLVRCGTGAIFDVAVDIRKGSPTFGCWGGFELSVANGHQLYVPAGFAHGFATLEPYSEIIYKCTDYYFPEAEGAVRWNSCGVDWPVSGDPVLSGKDRAAPILADFDSPFVYGENC
jgi:dTDP-4-dehydrorhamnose 3,5-epimerase